jgi:hypothetical protein
MQTISLAPASVDRVPDVKMIKGSFAEKYCAKHGLENWEFIESVLDHSLYMRARILRPLLRLIPGYFKADREFISSVGRLKRLRDFDLEAFAFVSDPDNTGFLRRRLNLRVSAGKLNGLFWGTMRDGSAQPFDVKK